MQFFIPVVYLSGVVLVVAVTYLLARRITNPSCVTSPWRRIISPCC